VWFGLESMLCSVKITVKFNHGVLSVFAGHSKGDSDGLQLQSKLW